MLTDKNEKEMKKYMFHRIALLFALLVISMPQMHAAEGSEEKSFDAKKVILYGSYARGDFRPDSEIDVMILVDTDRAGVSPLEKKICDVTYDFNDEHGTDIMPVVQSNTHFDYWKKADMFYRNVEKDGVVI